MKFNYYYEKFVSYLEIIVLYEAHTLTSVVYFVNSVLCTEKKMKHRFFNVLFRKQCTSARERKISKSNFSSCVIICFLFHRNKQNTHENHGNER